MAAISKNLGYQLQTLQHISNGLLNWSLRTTFYVYMHVVHFLYSLLLPFYPISMQISCLASSTELVDRVRFHYYFQLLPTPASIAPAFFGVIRQYGWRRWGLIVQNENLFTVVSFVVMNPVLIFRECVGLAKI